MAFRILLSRRLGELRWNQADLARATGIRAATINDLFHGIAVRVSFEQLDLICDALDCSPCEIIEWRPNTDSKVKTRTGKTLPDRSKRT